jgi:hypothetical protein
MKDFRMYFMNLLRNTVAVPKFRDECRNLATQMVETRGRNLTSLTRFEFDLITYFLNDAGVIYKFDTVQEGYNISFKVTIGLDLVITCGPFEYKYPFYYPSTAKNWKFLKEKIDSERNQVTADIITKTIDLMQSPEYEPIIKIHQKDAGECNPAEIFRSFESQNLRLVVVGSEDSPILSCRIEL